MAHELTRLGLDEVTNTTEFFNQYFGPEVSEKLNQLPTPFIDWSEDSKQTLMALCKLMAKLIPEADHVIRNDVETTHHAPRLNGNTSFYGELLMYFGVQVPLSRTGARRQHIGVTYRCNRSDVVFSLFIAGSPDPEERKRIINDEDVSRKIEGVSINNIADVKSFEENALAEINEQRKKIASRKYYKYGFTPKVCRLRWNCNAHLQFDKALGMAIRYWKEYQRNKDAEKVKTVMNALTRNRSRLRDDWANLVSEYIPVDMALILILNENGIEA